MLVNKLNDNYDISNINITSWVYWWCKNACFID